MKKVLVFLLICLSSTVVLAQRATATHWTPVIGENNMTMTSVLVLDGVEQYEAALNYEIGLFDEAGVCRGAKLPKRKASSGRYIYSLMIQQGTGGYTLRIWDHGTNNEMEVTYTGDPIVFVPDAIHGSAGNPVSLTFVTGGATGGFELPILGFGDVTNVQRFYLVATPIGEVAPTAVTAMIPEAAPYDLFSFDQSQNGQEWRNYKDNNFMLEPGKGYLYANQDDVTLVFSGEGYTELNEVPLVKDGEANCEGWNLVGNPFGELAYIDRPFYRMNEDGSDIMTESTTGAIAVMEGVFVAANEDGETLTFSTTEPDNRGSMVALNLSNGRSVVDRAIVSFSETRQLPKFQLRDNSTKVYIPMEGEDYAVVRSEGMGEMPVNFKAEENGTYSLSFAADNVEFAYLHLIDNKTGNDVDLLAKPSYSFEALTTDYASRFKLVFVTSEGSEDSFAFFNNGSFVIANEGEATLQVVDVTGRILKSETINGCANVNVNAAPGVYMIRLVKGDSMKVQKVVVK